MRVVKVVFFCTLAAAVLLDLTLHLAHAGAHLSLGWTARGDEEPPLTLNTPCALVDGVLDVETGNVMYNTPKPTGAHSSHQGACGRASASDERVNDGSSSRDNSVVTLVRISDRLHGSRHGWRWCTKTLTPRKPAVTVLLRILNPLANQLWGGGIMATS